jgi:hypothetical protein
MVSGVAWLSICRRIHPEPIIIRLPELGDEFDKDIHECKNYDEYCEKKAGILKLRADELDVILVEQQTKMAETQDHSSTEAASKSPPTRTVNEEMERGTELHERSESSKVGLFDHDIFKMRKGLVKTSMWPLIQIYSPVDKKQPSGQSGIAVYTVRKSQIAAQWVVPGNNSESKVSLHEWVE